MLCEHKPFSFKVCVRTLSARRGQFFHLHKVHSTRPKFHQKTTSPPDLSRPGQPHSQGAFSPNSLARHC